MFRILLTHTPSALALQFPEIALSKLRAYGELVCNPSETVLDDTSLADAAAGCSIVITDRQTSVTAEAITRLDTTLAIMRCAVDIRNIAVQAASAEGILVTRSVPTFANSVAELALGLMLDGARGITRSAIERHRGYPPIPRMGRELAGQTLGIVGLGVIGSRLAMLGQAMGMKVVAYDICAENFHSGIEQLSFQELLARSGFVVCLAPATLETHHLFGTSAFGSMRSDAMFINLARGELVDEDALTQALDKGQIAIAALDVGMAPDQRPSARFADRVNVISTPHIGGQTPQAIEGQALHVCSQVKALSRRTIPSEALNVEHAHRIHSFAAEGQ